MTAQKKWAARQGGPATTHFDRGDTIRSITREQEAVALGLAQRRSEWMRAVIRDGALNDGDKVMAVTLALYVRGDSPFCWAGQDELVRQTTADARTIRRRVANLEARGYVLTERRNGGKWNSNRNKRGKSNVYHLSLPNGVTLDDKKDGDRAPPTTTGRS
jgi:hypothetical protein